MSAGRRKNSPLSLTNTPGSRRRAPSLLLSILLFTGAVGWLTVAARAQGDNVLAHQLTLGTVDGDGGSPGTGPGQFVYPFGVAIDSTGRIIVTDTESYVCVPDPSTPDPDDCIWVVDVASNRVQIFSPDGTTVEHVIQAGGDFGTLWYPTSVAVDALDRVIVSDNENNRVLVFSLTRDVNGVVIGSTLEAEFSTFSFGGNPDDALAWPAGVAVKPGTALFDQGDSAGRIAIADNSNNRVVVLNSMLQPVLIFGGSGGVEDAPEGTFEGPWGVAIDSQGWFFVSDSNNHRVQVFDAGGVFQWLFGPASLTPGDAPAPGDLAWPAGLALDLSDADEAEPVARLLVSDTDRSRVLRIEITTDLGPGSPLPLCSDYAVAEEESQCQVATSDGRHLAALVLGGPSLSGAYRFWHAQGVATDSQGRVAIADTDNHLVKIFQPARIEIADAVASADLDGGAVGETVDLAVTVRNTGLSALDVTLDVTPSLAGTLAGDLSEPIGPGGAHVFTLTFVPSEVGDLTFTVNAEGLHVSGATAHATPFTTTPPIAVAAAPVPSLSGTIETDRAVVGVNETFTVTVTLSNTGSVPFTDVSPAVEPSSGIVELRSGPTPPFDGNLESGSRTLTYTYQTLTQEGAVSFSLTVTAKYEDLDGVHDYSPVVTATSRTVQISTDILPPVTTLTRPPPTGNLNWYRAPFSVTLGAVDNEGGSGVQSLRYRVWSPVGQSSISTTIQPAEIRIQYDGETTISYYAVDAAGNEEVERTETFRLDTVAPTINSVDITPTANANGWHNTDVIVKVGSADDLTSGVASAPPVLVTTEGAGQVHAVSVFDVAGNEATTNVTLNIDRTPPVVTCGTLTMGVVWPPNHKLVPWRTSVAVGDALSGAAGFVLASATSSEPDNGRADGNTTNDIQGFDIGTPDTAGFIRAERSGKGNGRVYSLTYEGRDLAGNMAACTVLTRLVPHDRRDRDDGDDDDERETKKPTKKPAGKDQGKKK